MPGDERLLAEVDGDEVVALEKAITERLIGLPASSAYAVGTALVLVGFKQVVGHSPSPHEFAGLVERFTEMLAVRGFRVM